MVNIAARPAKVAKKSAALAVLASLLCLSGASAANAETLTGTVLNNNAPASGVRVTVYGAGSSSATVLGKPAVTASNGAFKVTYTPPAAGLVYSMTQDASGRRREMAVVGPPSALEASVKINERTTVAAAFALAQFFHGSAIYGAQPGLGNAGATALNLADPRTGKLSSVLANSPNGNASATLPTFNTLANVVLSCTRGTSADCARLLKAAKVPGQSAPTNTVTAIAGIARNPTTNPKGLFRLAATKRNYTVALSKAPVSWLIGLVYTAGGFNAPGYIAFDAAGNSWTGNNFAPGGTSGVGASVTALSPTGTPLFGGLILGGGLQGVGWGGAVAPDGNIWIANYGGDSMSLLGPGGQILSPAEGYRVAGQPDPTADPVIPGFSKPQGIAVAADGTVWIANFGNDSVTSYPQGNPLLAKSFTAGGISKPFSVVIDDQGYIWVTNDAEETSPGTITKLNPDGTPVAGSPFSASGLRSVQGLAVDSGGNIWAANQFSNSVVQLKPNGQPASGSPYKHESLYRAWGIAIDGKDRVWVGGFGRPSIMELCGRQVSACPPGSKTGSLISPAKGFTSAAMQRFTAVAIDSSGNVWGAHNYSSSEPIRDFVGGNGLFEIIGAAAPVKTPMLGAVKQP